MNFRFSNVRAFAAALLLVLVTNAIALGGVAYNRSGQPESTLQLTEREIPIPFLYRGWGADESGNVTVRLEWRLPRTNLNCDESDGYNRDADWLNDDQLRALGFEVPRGPLPISDTYRDEMRQLPRAVFLVLEFDGPAHRAVLECSRK